MSFAEAPAVEWVLGGALAAAVVRLVGRDRCRSRPHAPPVLSGNAAVANNLLQVALVRVVGFDAVHPVAARGLGPALVRIAALALAALWFAERRTVAILAMGLAAARTVAYWRRRGKGTWPLAHLGGAVLLAVRT